MAGDFISFSPLSNLCKPGTSMTLGELLYHPSGGEAESSKIISSGTGLGAV